MKYRIVISLCLAVLWVVSRAGVAAAHGGQPRLEISPGRINPGGVLDVRGVEFDYEEVVTLTLIGSQSEIALADITANVDGEFIHIVTLPTDLMEGTYYIRGTTSHHWALSAPLTVWGIAVEEGGGQGPIDEDDGLLAPMPTYPPAAQAVATRSGPVASTPVEANPVSAGWGTNILILAALMVIAAAVTLMLGRKRAA